VFKAGEEAARFTALPNEADVEKALVA